MYTVQTRSQRLQSLAEGGEANQAEDSNESEENKLVESVKMDNLHIRLPEPLKLDGNVAENWRVFKQNFDIFAIAIELNKKSDAVKVATFLNACGTEAIETFNTFDLEEAEESKFDSVVAGFKAYCEPKKNEVYEAFKFNSWNQEPSEISTISCWT